MTATSFSLSSFQHLYFYLIEAFICLGIVAEMVCIFAHQRYVSNIKFIDLFENYVVMLVLMMILVDIYSENRFPMLTGTQIAACILTGIITTALFLLITHYYAHPAFRPVISIAKASTTGHATNIIEGLAIAMESTSFPVLLLCASILMSFVISGIFGLAITAITMMALSGMIIKLQSYQGYSIGSACLAGLVLFLFYLIELPYYFPHVKIDLILQNPFTVVGLFMGGLIIYLLSSISMMSIHTLFFDIILPLPQFLLAVIVPILFFFIVDAITNRASGFVF